MQYCPEDVSSQVLSKAGFFLPSLFSRDHSVGLDSTARHGCEVPRRRPPRRAQHHAPAPGVVIPPRPWLSTTPPGLSARPRPRRLPAAPVSRDARLELQWCRAEGEEHRWVEIAPGIISYTTRTGPEQVASIASGGNTDFQHRRSMLCPELLVDFGWPAGRDRT